MAWHGSVGAAAPVVQNHQQVADTGFAVLVEVFLAVFVVTVAPALYQQKKVFDVDERIHVDVGRTGTCRASDEECEDLLAVVAWQSAPAWIDGIGESGRSHWRRECMAIDAVHCLTVVGQL